MIRGSDFWLIHNLQKEGTNVNQNRHVKYAFTLSQHCSNLVDVE